MPKAHAFQAWVKAAYLPHNIFLVYQQAHAFRHGLLTQNSTAALLKLPAITP
jgi:hypothetical protein